MSHILTRYQQLILQDHPLAYWRMSERSGTNIADISGNGYHGTVTGANIVLGARGAIPNDPDPAISSSADDASYIQTPDMPVLDAITGAFSIEVWALTNTLTVANVIRGIWAANSGVTGYAYLALNTTSKIILRIAPGASTITPASAAIITGQWYHAVGIWDGTNAYVVLNGIKGTPVAGSGNMTFHTGTGAIARYDTATNRSWNGSIDEVAIYAYALSAQQTLDHYRIGTCRK